MKLITWSSLLATNYVIVYAYIKSELTMKKYTVCILVVLLTGCIEDNDNGGTGGDLLFTWSGVITERSANFILTHRIASNGSQIGNVERWWVEVQTCTGISIALHEPLIIEYVPSQQVAPFIGWIAWRHRYIRVEDLDLHTIRDGVTTKHEMIHYILFLTGMPDNPNASHVSVLFDYCAGI